MAVAATVSLATYPAPPRPGQLWRRALGMLQDRLEADGMSPDGAAEMGESVVIGCALHHVPGDLEEAYRLLLSSVCRLGRPLT